MEKYGRLCTEFYDLDKPGPPPDAFDFYAAFAREARGPIHEPMCGTGRFLLPLAAEGLDISGSDASSEMLAACRRRGNGLGIEPRLSQQALGSLSCEPAPALIFIPSGSFALLIDDESVVAALSRVHQALAPGGTFLVEIELHKAAVPEHSGTWGGRWVERPDGAKIILSWLSQYSGAPQVSASLHRYELVKDGQLMATEFEDFRVRSYVSAEFQGLLAKAGFEDIQELRTFDRCPPDPDDDAVVFRCRRPS